MDALGERRNVLIGAAFLLLSPGLAATTLALELRADARQQRYDEIASAAAGGLYFPTRSDLRDRR